MNSYSWIVGSLLLLLLITGCATTTENNKQAPTRYALQDLTPADAERLLVRGRTQQYQVQQWFGQPSGLSKSGEHNYWNYTYSYHQADTGRSGLVILTVVFDKNLLVVDYDLQSNRYQESN